jgi:hypothetical protein
VARNDICNTVSGPQGTYQLIMLQFPMFRVYYSSTQWDACRGVIIGL